MPYGSGSANKSLEANRSMLRKRQKEKISYVTSNDKANAFEKEATPEQLQEIRERMQQQKKQEQITFIIITIIALIIVYFFATATDWHWLFKNFKR